MAAPLLLLPRRVDDLIEGVPPFDSRLDMQLVVRDDEFLPLSMDEGPDMTDVFPLSRLDGPLCCCCMLRKCFSRSWLIFSSKRCLCCALALSSAGDRDCSRILDLEWPELMDRGRLPLE